MDKTGFFERRVDPDALRGVITPDGTPLRDDGFSALGPMRRRTCTSTECPLRCSYHVDSSRKGVSDEV